VEALRDPQITDKQIVRGFFGVANRAFPLTKSSVFPTRILFYFTLFAILSPIAASVLVWKNDAGGEDAGLLFLFLVIICLIAIFVLPGALALYSAISMLGITLALAIRNTILAVIVEIAASLMFIAGWVAIGEFLVDGIDAGEFGLMMLTIAAIGINGLALPYIFLRLLEKIARRLVAHDRRRELAKPFLEFNIT
jgi:hypothetical protein